MHNSLAPGLGKIGVLVALESEAAGEALATLGRQLAMHVAAANPQYLDIASVPAAALDRERAVLREQARGSGKSEEIVDAHGRGPAAQVLRRGGAARPGLRDRRRNAGCPRSSRQRPKQAGAPIRVAGFVRFALGEGIEKPPSDFAAEVGAHAEELTRDASLPRCERVIPAVTEAGEVPLDPTLTAKSLRAGSDASAAADCLSEDHGRTGGIDGC